MATQVQFPKEEPVVLPGFSAPEAPKDKLFRKLKEQPMVPIGSLLTCAALVVASHHLRTGNRASFNRALRWRIYFQGITVVAAIGGVYYYGLNSPPPEPPVPSSSDDSNAAAASSVYDSIATTPGRPPTNFQISREEERQGKSKKEWQDRFQAAQKRAADEPAEQRRLEEALLKGTGLSLDGHRATPEGAGTSAPAGQGKSDDDRMWEEKAAAAAALVPERTRPVIGQDRRRER